VPHNQSNTATLNTSNPATASGPLLAAAGPDVTRTALVDSSCCWHLKLQKKKKHGQCTGVSKVTALPVRSAQGALVGSAVVPVVPVELLVDSCCLCCHSVLILASHCSFVSSVLAYGQYLSVLNWLCPVPTNKNKYHTLDKITYQPWGGYTCYTYRPGVASWGPVHPPYLGPPVLPSPSSIRWSWKQ